MVQSQAQQPAFPPRDLTKPAEQQGMFSKFHVERVDGSSAKGGKHHGCRYWVLDLDHDKHAPAAMRGYAEDCKETHPVLSAEIFAEFGMQSQAQQNGKCDECGKSQSDGFALYCVKCIDMISTKEKSKPESLLLDTTNQHEASFTLAIDEDCNTHEFNIHPASGIELCVKCGLSKMLYKKSQAQSEAVGEVQHFAAPANLPAYVNVKWYGKPPKNGAKVYAIPPAPEGE